MAVQSCVYREYRSGLRTQPCGAPVLRVRGDDVLLPILTTCQEVQDPAAQRSVQSQSLKKKVAERVCNVAKLATLCISISPTTGWATGQT